MPTVEWMEAEIRKVLPEAEIEVTDLTGTSDHFHALIVDESLAGMRPLARQRLLLAHFKPFIPHEVHALDLKMLTADELAAREARDSGA